MKKENNNIDFYFLEDLETTDATDNKSMVGFDTTLVSVPEVEPKKETKFIQNVCEDSDSENNSSFVLLMENNKMGIKLQIENALKKKNRSIKKKSYEELFLNRKQDVIIFSDVKHDLTGEKVRAFDVILNGKEIYATEDMLLVLDDNNVITVYKWNSELKLKKIRDMKIHLLTFHIKTKSFNEKTRLAIYNIFITLISQGLERIDDFLEDILFFLNIDQIKEIMLINEFLICLYKNGNTKVYNKKLQKVEGFDHNKIEEYLNETKLNVMDTVDYDRVALNIKKNCIEVNHKEKSFIECIDIPHIKQCVYAGNFLFLLKSDGIRVLKFYD